MARKRKPCDFCEDNVFSDYVEGRNGFCIWYESYPLNNHLTFIAQVA